MTTSATENGTGRPSGTNPTLRTAAENWPTPHGFNGQDKDGGYGTGGEFEKFCKLWATPNASVANDGEGPETWRARQETLKEKGYNGNGAGVPLAIQAQESAALWAPPGTAMSSMYAEDDETLAARMNRHGRTTKSGESTLAKDVSRWPGPASRPDPTTATAGEPSSPSTPTLRLQLNERFVAVLMGLAPGWINCEPSATPSSPSKPKPPSESSGGVLLERP